MEGINGKKLGEGDPSEVYVVDQEELDTYKDSWRKVRAQVQDTTGKAWLSRKLKRGQKPSWAK